MHVANTGFSHMRLGFISQMKPLVSVDCCNEVNAKLSMQTCSQGSCLEGIMFTMLTMWLLGMSLVAQVLS